MINITAIERAIDYLLKYDLMKEHVDKEGMFLIEEEGLVTLINRYVKELEKHK